MRVSMEYKITANDGSWESDWEYFEIKLNWIESCAYMWIMERKVVSFRYPINRFLQRYVLSVCEKKAKTYEAKVFAELGGNINNSSSGDMQFSWDFYVPRSEEDVPFIIEDFSVMKEVDKKLREMESREQGN